MLEVHNQFPGFEYHCGRVNRRHDRFHSGTSTLGRKIKNKNKNVKCTKIGGQVTAYSTYLVSYIAVEGISDETTAFKNLRLK